MREGKKGKPKKPKQNPQLKVHQIFQTTDYPGRFPAFSMKKLPLTSSVEY